jgi:hypothetical protein
VILRNALGPHLHGSDKPSKEGYEKAIRLYLAQDKGKGKFGQKEIAEWINIDLYP